MSDRELWLMSLAIAAGVVVVVALLLGLIIALLKSIDRNAANVSTIGKQIAQNTVALWTLEQSDRDLARLTDAVRALDQSLLTVAGRRSGTASEVADKVAGVKQKVESWLSRSDADEMQ